jgi:arginyl-tRNA synthetase
MVQVKSELAQALAAAVAHIAPDAPFTPAFESPKQAAHGDLAITAAMPLAKSLKQSPRALAERLVAALNEQPAVRRWVSSLEIAGPGFINLRLSPAA